MEEGGWKSLLTINTENLCKIKLAKKDGNLLLMTFRTSLFHPQLPSSINQKFSSRLTLIYLSISHRYIKLINKLTIYIM